MVIGLQLVIYDFSIAKLGYHLTREQEGDGEGKPTSPECRGRSRQFFHGPPEFSNFRHQQNADVAGPTPNGSQRQPPQEMPPHSERSTWRKSTNKNTYKPT